MLFLELFLASVCPRFSHRQGYMHALREEREREGEGEAEDKGEREVDVG